MATLGSRKNAYLTQVRKLASTGTINVQFLFNELQKYEDLDINDFKGRIPDDMWNELKGLVPDPEAQSAWQEIVEADATSSDGQATQMVNKIKNYLNRFSFNEAEARSMLSRWEALMPPDASEGLWNVIREKDTAFDSLLQANDFQNDEATTELTNAGQALLSKLREYEVRFSNGSHIGEAQQRRYDVENVLKHVREEKDWRLLSRHNYGSLKSFQTRYPDSIHREELDDLMWDATKQDPTHQNFDRYIRDWPEGNHVEEAISARDEIREIDAILHPKIKIKDNDWILAVRKYMDLHPNSTFENVLQELYYKLRDRVLEKMRKNPTKFDQFTVEEFLNNSIFDEYELADGKIMTMDSWEYLKELDRDRFPKIQQFQVENPDITAPEGCTDIYFFGTPGTGKTCLLMGLAGANGQGYSLNMRVSGGPYASALQQYVIGRITPGRTFGNYVTSINGQIHETDKKGRLIEHNINFIEMSGEEFALRIANSKKQDSLELENSFSAMGTGATNLLTNANRKVFFIVVDCSDDTVDFNYIEEVKDESGFVIEQHPVQTYISQLDILNKFISLFSDPANQKIMERVDAIHFIVTKADMLSRDQLERREKAKELLTTKYLGPVQNLKAYCQRTRRINMASNYAPKAFTFSLGRFYLGDIFDFDNSETLQIIDTIRHFTSGSREKSWWDKFTDSLN